MRAPTTALERLAAYGASAALVSGVVAALGKRSSKRVKAATGHGPPEVSAAPALTDERVRAIAREEIVRAARGESPGAG